MSPLDRLLETVRRTAEPGEYQDAALNSWRREYQQDVPRLIAVIEVMRRALRGLTQPCTRQDFTVGELDEAVINIARVALDDADEAAGDMWYCRECGKGVTMADMVADEHANVWCQEHKP